MTKKTADVEDLLSFIVESPTPWHTVEELSQRLLKAGFEELSEGDAWSLKPGVNYFVARQGSSLCAFTMPQERVLSCRIAAAHTDSPGFRLKPKAEYRKENMVMLGLEVYGGPLLTSWLNRDLGIAGRVVCKEENVYVDRLVRLEDAPVVIPQLAIHLDRNVNENGLILNKQEHLAALAGIASLDDKTHFLEKQIKKAVHGDIISWDLLVYPLDPPRLIGKDHDLIVGYRLDNLCGVHAVLTGFLSHREKSRHQLNAVAFWDHEEIGSDTAQGAGSPFLSQTLERVAGSREDYFRLVSKSLCVSIDVGHALHPNYADKHEPRHQLLLNEGIILKSSAQYKYATDARTGAIIEDICKKQSLPYQRFTGRGDIPSGSTIGPVVAQQMGIPTVDVGIAQLSMHSCRELIGAKDQRDLTKLSSALFLPAE